MHRAGGRANDKQHKVTVAHGQAVAEVGHVMTLHTLIKKSLGCAR